jgi:hypothetical protein
VKRGKNGFKDQGGRHPTGLPHEASRGRVVCLSVMSIKQLYISVNEYIAVIEVCLSVVTSIPTD